MAGKTSVIISTFQEEVAVENKTKKKVFLQHSCNYTREGIKFLLASPEGTPVVVYEMKQLQINLGNLSGTIDADIDVFIFELQNYSCTATDLLYFIAKTMPLSFPKSKVIIMTELNSVGRFKDYILGFNNYSIILDNATKLDEMQLHLSEIIGLQGDFKIKKHPPKMSRLTSREMNVLDLMLKGNTCVEVADMLSIHQKTVSAHKISALHKLGMRSMYGLLISERNQEMISKMLQYQI